MEAKQGKTFPGGSFFSLFQNLILINMDVFYLDAMIMSL